MNNIILYSKPTCPQCKVLKMKLAKKEIPYEICESIEEMESLGIKGIPTLSVDGVLYGLEDANKWINGVAK